MRNIPRSIATAALLGLVACAQISGNPAQDALSSSGAFGTKVVLDATDAQFNLSQAVAVGALDATDPAPECVARANALLGIGGDPLPSFTPKVDGVLSFTSVAYIRVQQLKKMAGGVALPEPCYAVLGHMNIDALAAALRAAPGGGLLPAFR